MLEETIHKLKLQNSELMTENQDFRQKYRFLELENVNLKTQ
jgi:hypothetical protein